MQDNETIQLSGEVDSVVFRSENTGFAVIMLASGGELITAVGDFGNTEAGYSANMGLDEEDYGVASSIADTASAIQETTSVLPDYTFKGSDSAAGTAVSGIIGSGIVAGAAALAAIAFGLFRNRHAKES